MTLPLNHSSEYSKLLAQQLEMERLQRAATIDRRRVVAWRLGKLAEREAAKRSA